MIVKSVLNFQLGSIMEANKERLVVYPNPALDYIYLKGISSNPNFKIVDLSGKEMLFGRYNQGIDISQLGQGTYLLFINHNDNQEVLSFTK
jgi:hypothetical protein